MSASYDGFVCFVEQLFAVEKLVRVPKILTKSFPEILTIGR